MKQQNVAYYFKFGVCDADYVGFMSRHLHQRVEEHKRPIIGNHVKDEHGKDPEIIASNFKILKVLEQTRLLDLQDVFYSRTKAETE